MKNEIQDMNPKLVKEIENNLNQRSAYGQSRHEAKRDGSDKEKIFSKQTMKNYKQFGKQFAKFVYEQAPTCRHIKQAKKYIDPFIQSLIDKNYSPYTIKSYKASLSKIYGGDYCTVQTPARERKNITKNRENKWKGHFSELKNRDLVEFAKATGLRRSEIEALTYGDLTAMNIGDSFADILQSEKAYSKGYPSGKIQPSDTVPAIKVQQGKGGKSRVAPILNSDIYDRLLNQLKENPKLKNEKIFGTVPKYAPIHQYRQEYACELYKTFERESIPPFKDGEYYHCRKDKAGVSYDRRAMKMVSRCMGHNRVNVIAEHYLTQ